MTNWTRYFGRADERNPGARETQLKALEAAFGVRLPEDWLGFLTQADSLTGELSKGTNLILDNANEVAEITQERREMTLELADSRPELLVFRGRGRGRQPATGVRRASIRVASRAQRRTRERLRLRVGHVYGPARGTTPPRWRPGERRSGHEWTPCGTRVSRKVLDGVFESNRGLELPERSCAVADGERPLTHPPRPVASVNPALGDGPRRINGETHVLAEARQVVGVHIRHGALQALAQPCDGLVRVLMEGPQGLR